MMEIERREIARTFDSKIPTIRLLFNNKEGRVEINTDIDINLKVDGKWWGFIKKGTWYTCVPFPHDQMKIPDLMPVCDLEYCGRRDDPDCKELGGCEKCDPSSAEFIIIERDE